MIFGFAYYWFVEPKTIGHDIRYAIYIFWLPTIIGMLTLGIYRRQFLINRFATNKGFVLGTFMVFFYLLQGLIFSYISFGQIAKMSWDYANFQVAKENTTEKVECEVTKFWTRANTNKFQSDAVFFEFKNRSESLKVSYESIKQYKDKNPENYLVDIDARRGIWNYYLVDNWTIKEK